MTSAAITNLKFAILLSSVREGRMADRVGKFMTEFVKTKGHEPILIDPAQYKLPLLDKKLAHYRNQSDAPPALLEISEKLKSADAFIVCSAEYNHTVPAALSNLCSFFWSEYERKPSGIVSYSMGPFGGVRAAMALRPMLAELKTSSIPATLPIPIVQEAIDASGKVKNPLVQSSAETFFKELVWYTEALKSQRIKSPKNP